MRSHFDPLPYGLAFLALGLGTAVVTFLSLGADNVSYARTEWTALLAMVLAAPASVLFVLGAARESAGWRGFWSAGFLAYLLHLWWAVARTYDFDIGAIVAHQGWVAFANLAVTALWALDVLVSWWPFANRSAAAVVRLTAWLGVTASFFAASAVFKSGTVAVVGWILAALIVAAIVVRVKRSVGASFRQETHA